MSEEEKSPSGNPIYRYDNVEPKSWQPAYGEEHTIEEISNHIEKYLGKIEAVFHEIMSDLVHIDVYWVKPSADFPFHILVTSGMSDRPMNVPEGLEDHRYSELCILLPADWKIEGDPFNLMNEVFKDESNYWPVRWLKTIARFPHEYNTWVGWGHTIPNGENADALAENTKLGCIMLYPSISLPREFFELKVNDEKIIKFYCLYPLYKEEMEFKLKKGSEALTDKLEKYGIRDVIDIDRPNTCLKKGFLGLW